MSLHTVSRRPFRFCLTYWEHGDSFVSTAAEEFIVIRPGLHALLRQIPEKIHTGKKVPSFLQNNQGAMIRSSDNSTVHGDILVGVDGTYSAVRQHLFHDFKGKKTLPASDNVPLPFNCVCLVGQTEVLDPGYYLRPTMCLYLQLLLVVQAR